MEEAEPVLRTFPNVERYTEMVSVEQIIELLDHEVRPAGTMVVVQARHFCIEMRGVNRTGLATTTSAVRGVFCEARLRREFLAQLPQSNAFTLDDESDA